MNVLQYNICTFEIVKDLIINQYGYLLLPLRYYSLILSLVFGLGMDT